MSNTNPLSAIGVIVVSVAILVAMTVLLVLGKISYIEALNFLVVAAGLFGIHLVANAPSPSQQESLTQLVGQVTSVLPPLVAQAHTHPIPTSVPPAPTPVPPAVVPPAPPIDPTSMQAYVTSEMPAIPKPTQVTQP